MSKIIFSEKDILNLSKNKYVLKVSEKSITYTNEFKEHFINEYLLGKFPKQIFKEAGFDIDLIGHSRIESASMRWCATYEKNGCLCQKAAITPISENLLTKKDLSPEEIIEKQAIRIKILETQLEILKNLDGLEARLNNYLTYYSNYRYQV
jgi:putative transposase